MDALFGRAARLFKVDLSCARRPRSGAARRRRFRAARCSASPDRSTGSSSACAPSSAAQATTVATGGLAELIVPHTRTLVRHEPDLTLDGLRLVWQRNR